MDKQFQVIVSRSENYFEYYIISSYDTLEHAKQNMNNDIEQFAKQNRKWWICEYPRYHAVIKNPDWISKSTRKTDHKHHGISQHRRK